MHYKKHDSEEGFDVEALKRQEAEEARAEEARKVAKGLGLTQRQYNRMAGRKLGKPGLGALLRDAYKNKRYKG